MSGRSPDTSERLISLCANCLTQFFAAYRLVQPHGPPSLPIVTHLKWKRSYVCLLDSHTMCKFDVKITGGILRSNSW